jgi:hypothetical protein
MITEQLWREENSPRFAGDSQAFLVAQLAAMLSGECEMLITQDHIDAQIAEHDRFINKAKEELF